MRKLTLIAAFFMSGLFVAAQSSRIWSTYYGASGTDECYAMAVDLNGNVYIGGTTTSSAGFTAGGFQNVFGGGTEDAFLVKFDSSGNRLWATYYGGPNSDFGYDVATDQNGNIYLCGYTNSASGIASPGSYQDSIEGNTDAFLVKFDGAGNRLWATYFGGSQVEEGDNVEADAQGNVYLSGYTASSSGIAVGGFQTSFGGGTYDAYLAKFSSSGTLSWSTYYGGGSNDNAYGISIASSGDVYIAGQTGSSSGIASSGHQNTIGGGLDAYLAKFSSAGARLWGTYYGGTGGEFGLSTATDASGNVFLSGTTLSTTNISFNGHQNNFAGGNSDDFVVKFNSAGTRLWGTYYGGTQYEGAWHQLSTDAGGNLYFSGESYSSTGIGTPSGFQNFLTGTRNTFLAVFDPAGVRICATYYGQTVEFNGHAYPDGFGHVYLSGSTNSASGIASGGFQNAYAGSTDAFLVKFDMCATVIGFPENTESTISVFPNPSSGLFTLTCEPGAQVEVFNCKGMKVHTEIFTGAPLDLSALATGLYVVKVGSAKGIFKQRLILQR